MKYEFSTKFYSRLAILKAAYSFSDRAYVYIDIIDDYYVVDIESKDTDITEEEFKNELLFQELRCEINQQTKDIRNIIATRALASSVIGRNSVKESSAPNDNSILEDWFLNENKKV